MSRPRIIDCFPFHDELDLLECRLTELHDTVDAFVLVEADVTHQDAPKPYHFSDNAERFAPWADKITVVRATGLPTKTAAPDPWAREHAQRDWIAEGLAQLDLTGSDIVLQSDVDEIPRTLHARNVRPGGGFVVFGQRGHFWAVDWFYPIEWHGTVAGTVTSLSRIGSRPLVKMRDIRLTGTCPQHMRDAGWHLSWLGGPERVTKSSARSVTPRLPTTSTTARRRPALLARGHPRGRHQDGARRRRRGLARVDPSGQRSAVLVSAPLMFTEQWFHPPSQRALAWLARSTTNVDGTVVEVGCWEGRVDGRSRPSGRPRRRPCGRHVARIPGEPSADLAAERDVFATFVRQHRRVDGRQRGRPSGRLAGILRRAHRSRPLPARRRRALLPGGVRQHRGGTAAHGRWRRDVRR
jgi:hypothetical protein